MYFKGELQRAERRLLAARGVAVQLGDQMDGGEMQPQKQSSKQTVTFSLKSIDCNSDFVFCSVKEQPVHERLHKRGATPVQILLQQRQADGDEPGEVQPLYDPGRESHVLWPKR